MRNALRIGSLAGIEIAVHPSWLIAFGLVSWSLAQGYFPHLYGGWSDAEYWLAGIAGALLLFGSVLVHELSHSFMALAQGVGVHSITLFVFGGVSNLKSEARRPRDELLTAAVGPLTSLLLALVFGLVGMLGTNRLPVQARAVFEYLGTVNLVLGLFNLVPGFPLDGGRVLRAAIWWLTGSLRRATRIAASIGQLVGYGLIAWGVFQLVGGNLIGGLWIAFIGWFLNNAAEASLVQALLEQQLAGLRVAQVMEADAAGVSPDLTVAELVDGHLLRRDVRAVPVVDGPRLIGLVTLTDVRRIPRELWAERSVGEAMTPLAALRVVAPGEPLDTAFKLIVEHDLNQLPVVQDGRLVGLLSRRGLLRYVQIRDELGLEELPAADAADVPPRSDRAA